MLGRVALRRVDVDWDDREKDVDDERAWKSRGRGRFTGRSTNETKGDLLTGVTPAPNDMAIEEAEIEGGADDEKEVYDAEVREPPCIAAADSCSCLLNHH